MAITGEAETGRVVAIWRYPVKSMMGEELNGVAVTPGGVLGDRRYALIDVETGKAGSAKNPRRWPGLFDFRATYVEPPTDASAVPPARVMLPDGSTVTSDDPEVADRLSSAIGRPVRLAAAPPEGLKSEGYWPDHDWIEGRNSVFEFELPSGTFFDGAPIHLVTTATLDHLRNLAPSARFDARRFRPNFVIEAEGEGLVEDGWIGRTIRVGADLRLAIWRPTPRCVMTTLPQGDLPKDPMILKTAVQANWGNVGVYATVVHGGQVRRGDGVVVE
jgi:uncharacterized protein YcbX